MTAVIGVTLARWLIPGGSGREGRLGFVLLLPVLWLWKKIPGILRDGFPGAGRRRKMTVGMGRFHCEKGNP
ncbi:hypothetical protein [Mameliella sp.]|uniref:hypothetical protein n=1 Tax=Mameliella sp. TaxID=1924940 RepID=UPI003BACA976